MKCNCVRTSAFFFSLSFSVVCLDFFGLYSAGFFAAGAQFKKVSRSGLLRFVGEVVVVSRDGEDEKLASDDEELVEYVLLECKPYVRLTTGFADDMVIKRWRKKVKV